MLEVQMKGVRVREWILLDEDPVQREILGIGDQHLLGPASAAARPGVQARAPPEETISLTSLLHPAVRNRCRFDCVLDG
jgi:hypothetical protein